MPLFPLTYFLSFWQLIGVPHTILLYQFLSMSTKGIFATILIDIHKDALLVAYGELNEERRANDSRRAFLKYLFHEVRTPLNSLSIGIEILNRSSTLDEVERESLLMMSSASEFMAGTLNDVLSMQKIEEGKMELEFRPFSLEEVIHSIFSTYRGAAFAKKLHLVKKMESNVPERTLGDKFKIEHVVGNLLSNAIKFSPPGGTITVSATIVDDALDDIHRGYIQTNNFHPELNSVKVKLSVRDEGPGIPKEHQAKLFGSFVQIRAGDLQNGGGSGLGLSLCKQITELHGGSVGFESVEGRGSEFFVILPLQVKESSSHSRNPLSVFISPPEECQDNFELNVVTPMTADIRDPNESAHQPKLHVLIVDGDD